MQTIDPKNLPTEFRLSDARKADLGEHPRLLDDLLYIGLMVLYSEPGLGKSMLSGQIEEHLAYGRPFGQWPIERPVRCMVIDLEGDMRQAGERSLTISPYGILPSDNDREMPADVYYATEWGDPLFAFHQRVELLEERLKAAKDGGVPFEYVRIDTMRLFLGSKPHGQNAYEWDQKCLTRLNKLALKYDVALVVVHHTNKAGEVSGSTGIAGSCTVVAQLKRNPDNDDECLLMSHKVRNDAPFRYALAMDDRGRWQFTEDITPTQAALGGTKRSIVNVLTAQGHMVLADLREALQGIAPNTLKSALRRLAHDGVAVYRRGAWQLTQTALDGHPKCHLCGLPMESFEPGQITHPTCVPDPFAEDTVRRFLGMPTVPAQAPAPAADTETARTHIEDQEEDGHPQEEAEEDHPEVAKFPAMAELRSSIELSRMKPLPVVPKVEREGKPWSLVGEKLDGQFRAKAWEGAVPEGTELVVVLDRNGSFPSAMSSVPVAPNKLKHTGRLGADPLERQNLAGLFKIRIPEWDDTKIPSPLGRAAERPDDDGCVWVTGSHMELLDRLAKDGRIRVVEVVDSWTGRRNASLFERYYKWTKAVREQTAGADADTRFAAKGAIVRAIRSIHPRQARSPFWRPDWHKAIVAQASVRHWATADRAVQGGAVLLSIGNVDEVAFAVPADVEAPRLWVPAPYRLGAEYAQVKHKEVKVGTELHMSPVTLDVWQNRGRRAQR